MKVELRNTSAAVELRVDGEGKNMAVGHAPVWHRLSQNLGGFVERVAPEAFSQSIVESDVRALKNHDPSLLLGRSKNPTGGAPTLRLVSDEIGCAFECDLPDTTAGRDVAEELRRGDMSGSSFGFRLMPDGDEWDLTEEGFPRRTIRKATLLDVSPVTYPAYLDSESGLRAEQRSVLFAPLAAKLGRPIEEVFEAADEGRLQDLMNADTREADDLRETRSTPWTVAARRELRRYEAEREFGRP